MSVHDEIAGVGDRWWRFAQLDLRAAEQLTAQPDPIFHTICFTCQQAVEKALKTIFVFLQIDIPHTHDLALLCELVPEDWAVRESASDLEWLTDWAVAGRYPGNLPEAASADAERALSFAHEFVALTRSELEKRGILK